MLFKKYHFSIFFISLLLILFSIYLFDNYDYELKYSFAIQDAILSNKTIPYFIKQGDYNFQTIRDFHTAIKWYDKALATDETNVEAISKKGEALSRLYNYSEAAELVDKALDSEPNSVIPLYAKGYTLYNQGNFTEAIKYYDEALAVNPRDAETLTNKGEIFSDQGKYSEAIKYL